MTQAELPQLSLRRYFDLVKRRRWQVVPVSLLGLLVGGLVAFFIPRYFVAETVLIHQQLPGRPSDPENPFKQIVASAKTSIPLYAGAAVEALSWPEVNALSDFDRQQFFRGIEQRIGVQDRSGGDRTRTFATLYVQYRDRDGKRSADLLNKLVDVWMKERLEVLRTPAKKRSQEARDQATRALKTLQDYNVEKQALELRYGINPQIDSLTQQREFPEKQRALKERKDELLKKKSNRIRLEVKVEGLRKEKALLSARVEPEAQVWLLEALNNPQAAASLPGLRVLEAKFKNTYQPNTPKWYQAKRAYEMEVARIKAMLPAVEVGPDGKLANPDYTKKQAEIEKLETEIEVLRREIEQIEEDLASEAQRLLELQEGYRLYDDKLGRIAEAQDVRDEALTAQKEANAQLAELTRDVPVQVLRPAQVPPTPTEPNILVVALIGCVLGLGAAIGLILLLDMLQGSYKTLDDVERGLAVPVLGGVSYLETEEERVAAVRGRKRATIAAAAALFLVTVVVTVFYVDPTRLPSVVRDILTMLLGA